MNRLTGVQGQSWSDGSPLQSLPHILQRWATYRSRIPHWHPGKGFLTLPSFWKINKYLYGDLDSLGMYWVRIYKWVMCVSLSESKIWKDMISVGGFLVIFPPYLFSNCFFLLVVCLWTMFSTPSLTFTGSIWWPTVLSSLRLFCDVIPVGFVLFLFYFGVFFLTMCWFHHPWDKLQLTRPFIIRPLRVFLVSFVKLPLPTFHPVGLFAFSPRLCTSALCSLGTYVHWHPLYRG